MTQLTRPERSLGPNSKFIFVVLINLFIPALGNFLLIAKSSGNLICLAITLFAYGGRDWRVLAAWALFMNIRAYVDIYITPGRQGRTITTNSGSSNAGALRAVAMPGNDPAYKHHHTPEGEFDARNYDHDGLAQYEAGRSISYGEFDDAGHHADSGRIAHLKDQAHGAHGGLHHGDDASHGDGHAAHGDGTAAHADGHAVAHNAFVPYNAATHHHASDDSANSHGAALPQNHQAPGDHEFSHGAPMPLNAPHNTGEHSTAHAPHHLTPEHLHGQAINPHKVVESLLHPADNAAAAEASSMLKNPHEHQLDSEHPQEGAPLSKLVHPDGPFSSGVSTHALEHKIETASDSEGGVIYDIYGEEEEEGGGSKLSPLDEGLYHAIGDGGDAAPAAAEHAQDVPDNEAVSGEAGPHSHQLKKVMYGADESETGRLQHPHEKRIQLCLTCQRPREHHRPTCAACGTPFDDDLG